MRRAMVLLGCLVGLLSGPALAVEPAGVAAENELEKGIARFESGDYSAALHARVQAWGGWVGEDSLLSNGSPMEQSGFRLRRTRFRIDGTFPQDFSYALELEVFDQERLGGPLYKAFVDYNPCHWFGARVGVDRFLLVRSDIISSSALPHLDRPLGTLLISPANALGLMLYSSPWEDHLTVALGLYNGLRRDSSSLHAGYEGVGISLGNRFDGMSAAARIDLEPLNPLGRGLADVAKAKDFRLGLGIGGFLNGTEDIPLLDGGSLETSGLSGYLHLKWAGLHLFGEYTQEWTKARVQPTTPVPEANLDSNRWVANVSLGYVILENMLGIAVRGELLDPDDTTDDEGDEWLVAATASYYIVGEYLKAQLEYTHRQERFGTEVENDTVLAGIQLVF